MKTRSLATLVAELAALPRSARTRGGNTANARLVLSKVLSGASPEARQRFTRTLEIQGLFGKRTDQVPQDPWPAFEAGLLGGEPRIAELLPPPVRMEVVRRASLAGRPPRSAAMEQGLLDQVPETLAWRAEQKKLWTALTAARDEYRADALKHGATAVAAEAAAGKHVRGDVRVVIGTLLVRAPAKAVAQFIADGPRDWGIETERLLGAGPVVPALIDQAFPKPEWAKNIDNLEKKLAEDDASWAKYVDGALVVLGDAASTAKDAVWGVGSTLGEVATDVSGGVGGLLGGLGKGLSWLPIGLGIVGVGAVAVVLSTRRRADPPRMDPEPEEETRP